MTFGDLYVLTIIVIYLAAFFIRNLKTYFNVKTSIRGRSTKLTLSLVLSTVIYLITFANLIPSRFTVPIGKITFLEFLIIQYVGYGFILVALIIGLTALYEMRNSWRVGIKHDQKTDLVTTGIYTISRNPYFLSYDLLFFGIFMIYPSFTLLFLIVALTIVFHLMIREEENYLEKMQGKPYQLYKNKVGRYLVFF